jgi:hypothetical protein
MAAPRATKSSCATRHRSRLANQASLASATDAGVFCNATTATLRQVVTVAVKDFESLVVGRKAYASDLGPAAKIGACKTAATETPAPTKTAAAKPL